MKVTSAFIRRLQLDPMYCLLTARSCRLIWEYFKLLDSRGAGGIDDVQFEAFLSGCTDLSKKQIIKVFDIFDLDRSGSCEFDEVCGGAGARGEGGGTLFCVKRRADVSASCGREKREGGPRACWRQGGNGREWRRGERRGRGGGGGGGCVCRLSRRFFFLPPARPPIGLLSAPTTPPPLVF
ncbi:MAG: hypothetical protein BJ554DRAFT_7682 [Olpidium bornovanus]|uniref:EF-hand domain-containing protein n=1 Tax=Olpidium bornovanus TaxID=278681 RepID=A0A8H7ZVI2_9FUNG|nr:MAG: hypothetical protein BJ554DRAFT_7682 [Olpidium bornovanus]